MSDLDLEALRAWVGKSAVSTDLLCSRHARLLAATLGMPTNACEIGQPMPPLWHWTYFLDGEPETKLGRDGHPARGGFLPPVPLPNRMWAGGTLEFHQALPFGAVVERRSTVVSIDHKLGRSGHLVFVKVQHQVFYEGVLALTEYHNIVYKEAANAVLPSIERATDTKKAMYSREFYPSTTTLFRYSALTFNGHRIHYDADYCRNIEGYDNLVIHGPLKATLLANYALEIAGKPLKTFEYRGLRPATLGAKMSLNAQPESDGLSLWTALEDGTPTMQAWATF